MGNIGDLVATATLDISPFMSNTRNLKTYMKGLDNSLKAVEKSFQGHGGRIKGLKAVYAETGSALKGYQELLKTQSQKYSDLKKEIGDVNNATAEQKQKLIGAKSAMLETAAQVAELQNRLRALATETSVFTRFGKAAERIGGKMKSFGDSVAGVGAAFTRGVTAPIVAGAGYAIKAAVDYESAFAGVKKTVDETATVSYAKLSQGIRQMAKELPASAVEIAHVAEAAGQLGVKTGDILSFSRTMIDLGESTNLSAEEAATSIAKIANITGLASSEYSRFGSAVVALGNNFATTERDIVAMTNRIAASGKLAGLTNQEMLALATAMSSVGIEAEAGGTAMTQSLSAIERAVASGGDNLNKFAQIANMSSADFARAWKEKPIVALQEFIKGLGQLDKKGESATKVLDELGLSGIRQSNMLKSLGLASETLGKALGISNKAWKENTALTDEANKRYETTESKLKMLKNEVNDVAIEFDDLKNKVSETSETSRLNAEILGNNGKTRYNKNLLVGDPNRTKTYDEDYIEVEANDGGFKRGETYTISFSQTCELLQKVAITLTQTNNKGIKLTLKPTKAKMDAQTFEVTKDKEVISVYPLSYTAVLTGDWYKSKQVDLNASEMQNLALEMSYREVVDGNNTDLVLEWAENPDIIFDGNGGI